MDFKQLQSFYVLSSELNFTKAASKLGYTQACITLHIKKLEEEFGIPLFDRIGKKVTMTEAGHNLLPMVGQLLKMSQNLLETANEDDSKHKTIRIGICDSLCVEKMPRIIKAFSHLYPDVDIYLKILKCSEFLCELRNNTIDLAYTIGYLNKIPEIQYTAEALEPILVLASPTHQLASQETLTPSDFNGVPLLMAEPAAYYRKNFLNDLEHNGIHPKVILETESLQAIKNLTESGLGVCVLPKTSTIAEIHAKKLVPLNYICNYDIKSQIIWHRDKWLSNTLKEFIQIAEEVIAKLYLS